MGPRRVQVEAYLLLELKIQTVSPGGFSINTVDPTVSFDVRTAPWWIDLSQLTVF